MPVWSWFFIAAAVLIAFTLAWILFLSVTGRKRTKRLKQHFGPEYDRAVGEAGDQRAGEQELVARERKRQKLDIVALSPEAHATYAEHWRTVQTAFVDDPSRAVGDADRLVTQVIANAAIRLTISISVRPTSRSITRTWLSTIEPLTPSTWRKRKPTSARRRSVRRSSTTARYSRSCSAPT